MSQPPPGAPVPSPALFARSAAVPAAAAFGRVDEAGVVYVVTPDGEREVGSYPRASPREALAYFGRKYDELAAAVDLLSQRVTQTDMPTKDAALTLGRLREQVGSARVVGDLPALASRLEAVAEALEQRRAQAAEQRAAAKAAATAFREQLVAEAERLTAGPQGEAAWRTSGARLRALLEEWKTQQRSGPRLDKDVEAALWQRFSAARTGFDRARRAHFAQLEGVQTSAKATKQRLAAEAERLASSRDWAGTAGAFKRLMDEWRAAGRAGRADDEALWERFKAAQDAFFTAKDAVVAAEQSSLRANLVAKEALLAEAHALLPVTDVETAQAALRAVQDKWERAGKVPRGDLERTEKALRRVEQAVRDAQQRRWSSTNPEAAARARSLVDQLERSVASLEQQVDAARGAGSAAELTRALAARDTQQQWLAQARAGLEEFDPA